MARKFTSFANFSSDRNKGNVDESAETAKAKIEANHKIAEIKRKIQEMREDEDQIGAQILELDLKMAQLDLQKTDLRAQKDHLNKAKKISGENAKNGEKRKEG